MPKIQDSGRNNEYMKHLDPYADEVYVPVLDLTFTEDQPT